MPLTDAGRKVLGSLRKKHGAKTGEQVFYASINKGVAGSSKWHEGSARGANEYSNALKEG